jgi:GntR family transcriptional regulator
MKPDTWRLEFHSGIPAYKQIIHHLHAAVASGDLVEGEQLPTIRALHEILQVNPNTVARAYRDLQAMGVITTHQGSGCFVAPAPKQVALAPGVRKAKIGEITARLVSEARSHQIPLSLILEHLQQIQPRPMHE